MGVESGGDGNEDDLRDLLARANESVLLADHYVDMQNTTIDPGRAILYGQDGALAFANAKIAMDRIHELVDGEE